SYKCQIRQTLYPLQLLEKIEEMKTLLNPEYLEHDAYAMFSQLMETAEPWFSTFEHDGQKGKETLMPPIPFARPQDLGPTVAIVTKVNQIQDHLLKKHDIELYMHLNRLEIAPQIYGLRWVRLLFGREFPLQDLLVVWDALFADGLSLSLVDYIFIAMLLYIRDALISSNYQTCLGLLMHYPLIGDVHSLILKALFLRDPKKNPRPVTYQFHPNLDYYKARGADLMNKSRTNAKGAPLNINKVSNSLINFGRKLISPAMAPGSTGGPVPGSNSGNSSSAAFPTRTSAEALRHHLQPQQQQQQQQQQRLMKSESMPVQLNKGDIVTGSDAQVSVPVQTLTDLQGQNSKNISSSPSIESLPGGREFTGSPPSSATKKDSFFSNISRSRSHSKTMGRKESEEELEAQISFLQGQLNDLDAMCKYCAKVMDTHLVNIQDVILQENLEKEDQILVSLAGLKQIKDILKGSLRFNQSQLEAEENEQITIADDHYCSSGQGQNQQVPGSTKQASAETPGLTDRGGSDDFILVSKEDEGGSAKGHFSGQAQPLRTLKSTSGKSRTLACSPLVFSDPLMGPASASSSNPSSSPDDDSSKDSGFTIVSPLDI
uniref:TBC1 domain family member 5 n=1 Tax=Urocitellus parryii TaxID=9999 RepID=A0A8D2HTV8_UROPR